jgi:pimeloyl-ACP methyl ester carboxylesterase
MTPYHKTGSAARFDRRGKRNLHGLIVRLLVCTGMLAGQALMTVHAAPVAYQEDMLCGSDVSRPDLRAELHQGVLATPDGSIGYYRFGHGSPVVLITGYRASLAEWNAYFLDELAKNHEVIIFDNRGIGRSQVCSPNYGVKDLANETATLIRGLDLKNATVVGWSMGGVIAQQLAIDEPSLVGRLVLMSSMPPGRRAALPSAVVNRVLSGSGSGHFELVMAMLFPPSAQQKATQCFVGDMFAPAGYMEPVITEDVTRAQASILQRWKQNDHAFYRLGRVTAPALILTGTDDGVLWPRNSVLLSHALPNANLVEVKAGGHAMMYQYPRQLADRINAFIATAAGDGKTVTKAPAAGNGPRATPRGWSYTGSAVADCRQQMDRPD